MPRVKFTTTKGDVVIELFENEAPQSVANFITLVKQGFYNGVSFHRVIPGFMAQGGDPEGTGMGGPGYTIRDEQRAPGARRHFRGSLSMANTGRPNTGGSQFFLTFVPTSFLDGKHAVFGRVIEGMDVAASLNRGEPPRNPDKILKAEVLRDRGHAYEFEKLPES
ncbi:MAG: peptidylprolyl isomerase [Pirellulales bacterium]|nr:peptidylprolyl isomerase [Pirellulales bacterium]